MAWLASAMSSQERLECGSTFRKRNMQHIAYRPVSPTPYSTVAKLSPATISAARPDNQIPVVSDNQTQGRNGSTASRDGSQDPANNKGKQKANNATGKRQTLRKQQNTPQPPHRGTCPEKDANSNCLICDEPTDGQVIQCNNCDGWVCRQCIPKKYSDKEFKFLTQPEISWNCPSCIEEKQTL